MIQVCSFRDCRVTYGQRPPYDNNEETSGVCPKCYPKWLKSLDLDRPNYVIETLTDKGWERMSSSWYGNKDFAERVAENIASSKGIETRIKEMK